MFNSYFIVALCALLVSYLLGMLSDLLTLKTLARTLPREMEGIYDEAQRIKSLDYTALRTRFGMIAATARLTVLLTFWLLGGFNTLDVIIRRVGHGPIVTGLMYMAALFFSSSLLALPLSIYSTFVIEGRFGFNKTSPKTFITDRLKGVLLGVLIGGAVLAAVLWFFGAFLRWGWVMAWGGVGLFTVVVQYVAPTLIMPLFNKFTPLPEGALRAAIEALARETGFPLGGIYVMDGSRRSSKANAFFTGFGRTRRIALFDTLIDEHSVDELTAILAHEIGHYKRGHILTSLLIGLGELGVNLWLLSLVLSSPGLYSAFGMENPSVYSGLIFFGLLYTPVSLLLSLLTGAWSRHNEYQADAFAVAHAPSPNALPNALKKLSAKNLSNLTPHPLAVWLYYSHPPLRERLTAINGLLTGQR